MAERLRRMTAREVEDLLRQHGFKLISQKGSHRSGETKNPACKSSFPNTVAAHCH
jgi:predicted RNA binding protein YcfA (HicA-like mRNA interferase family)